nr:putative reverse transcriptase domain-containing protein [Tanacetum cinerariifolium]
MTTRGAGDQLLHHEVVELVDEWVEELEGLGSELMNLRVEGMTENLLPTILAKVGNQGDNQGINRNQNDDAVNENIEGDARNVIENNDLRGCSYKKFLACNLKEYDGKGACPRLNQAQRPGETIKLRLWLIVGDKVARGRAFMLGAEEARQDLNIMTGIEPNKLVFSYEIEKASGQLVEINNVIRNCKLEIEGHIFDIDLIPFGEASFDSIGERPNEKMSYLMSAKDNEQKQEEIVIVRDFFKTQEKHELHLGLVLELFKKENCMLSFASANSVCKKYSFLDMSDGVLYYLDKIWVPSKGDIRTLIMDEAHKSKYYVHLGGDKIYYDLRDMYWWPRLKKDVAVLAGLYLDEIVARHGVPVSIISDRDGRFTSRQIAQTDLMASNLLLLSILILKLLIFTGYAGSNVVELLDPHTKPRETRFWNHAMVKARHAAYTDRFHELARNRSLKKNPEKRSKVESRVGIGMGEMIIRGLTLEMPLLQLLILLGRSTLDCRIVPRMVDPVNARNLIADPRACFECGGTNHLKEACPR